MRPTGVLCILLCGWAEGLRLRHLVLTGELLVLAPGLKMFGEDPTVDGLIRRRHLSCDRKQNTRARVRMQRASGTHGRAVPTSPHISLLISQCRLPHDADAAGRGRAK